MDFTGRTDELRILLGKGSIETVVPSGWRTRSRDSTGHGCS